MGYFRDEDLPSCCDCDYATVYIPHFSYPYSDPFCSKGHGKCEVDKLCGDFKPITAVCGRCDFIRYKDVKKTSFICIKRNIKVCFDGRACDDYQVRDNEIEVLQMMKLEDWLLDLSRNYSVQHIDDVSEGVFVEAITSELFLVNHKDVKE